MAERVRAGGRRLHVDARFASRPITGVERYATQLLAHLSPTVVRHEPAAVVARIPMAGHGWEEIALPRQLSRSDVLLSPCNFGPLAHRRQFVTIHDLGPMVKPQFFSAAYRALFTSLVPLLARRADHVFAVSEAAATEIREVLELEPERVSVTPSGPSLILGDDETPHRSSRPYVLTVSSIEPRKNLAGLIRGFELFRALHPDFRLVAVGARPPGGVFGRGDVGDASEHVEFTGRVTDVVLRDLYRGASAFVTASRYEGFGLPMLDALVAAVPVAASDIPPFREMGGRSVRFFDPDEPESIGLAIAEALTVSGSVRRAESVRVAERYTWQAAAREVARAIHARYPDVEVLASTGF